MTLTSTVTTVSYAGNGSTTAFSVTYHFFDEDEIEVYLIDSSGTETLQDLGTDYTVTGGNGTTGTVTFGTAPATGYDVFIKRVTAQTQSVAYSDYGAFPAATHERALDRLTAEVQELARDVGTTLRLPVAEGAVDNLGLAVDRADQVLGFDSNGDPVLLDPADLAAGTTISYPYDISFDFGPSTVSASDVRRVVVPRDVTFPDNFAGSSATFAPDPAAQAVFTFSAATAGVETVIGALTIETDGSWAYSSVGSGNVVLAGGNGNYDYYLLVEPPSPADASLAAVSFTLKGSA